MGERKGLHTHALGRHWLHFAQVDSTNDYLKRHGHELPHGAAVTASVQTAGKGRLGRKWDEQPDYGLALSVLLHGCKTGELPLLPLVTGLAVAEGIEALCGAPCAIKWSNDLLVGGKKLCGILCESRIAARQGGFVVLGMGVNLLHSQADFNRHGLVYATSLQMATGKQYGREETAVAVLNALDPIIGQFCAEGFEPLRQRYKQRCVTLGRQVRVLRGGKEQLGNAVDIAPDGSLLCEIEGRLCQINAGEASVRGIYGYV